MLKFILVVAEYDTMGKGINLKETLDNFVRLFKDIEFLKSCFSIIVT